MWVHRLSAGVLSATLSATIAVADLQSQQDAFVPGCMVPFVTQKHDIDNKCSR